MGRLARKNLRDDSGPVSERIQMLIWALTTPGTESSRWKELIYLAAKQLLNEYERTNTHLSEP